MIDLNSRIRALYATAAGKDVLDKICLQLGLPSGLFRAWPLSCLKLKTVARLSGRELADTFAKLANSETAQLHPQNGSVSPKWFKEAVFYQIYPRSFMDSDGDGLGDIKGILNRLDYLEDLGVDALWLSPIFDSPNNDMGYDIRDYRRVMHEMGSMEDFSELLTACHARHMKVILDLVLNHSSDEHEWYQKALAGDTHYRDYYFFRKGNADCPPNNWSSFFSGPAWRYEAEAEAWALHLFTPQQPDLNWDNPALREELYEIVRFWLEKGVDGFRLDVINYISKAPGLPDGSEWVGKLMGFYGVEQYFYGPMLHSYLRELRAQAFSPYEAFSVGECPGLGTELLRLLTNETRAELDLAFGFDHLEMPGKVRFDDYRYDLNYYKKFIFRQNDAQNSADWGAVFFENHDNPRMVSKVNPDPKFRKPLAKCLAILLLSLRGSPFLFQGQELGAVNQAFTSIDQLRDIESLNKYQELLAAGRSEAEAWATLLAGTRDHARTPIDWTPQGGFSSGQPWLESRSVGDGFSADEQIHDRDSIWQLYRRMIALRKAERALIYGEFRPLHKRVKDLFCFERVLDGRCLTVEINLSASLHRRHFRPSADDELLLSNYETPLQEGGRLRAYEARIWGRTL